MCNVKVKIFKEKDADDWYEDMDFNFAFHQHYSYKGEVVDGIISKDEVLEDKEYWL